MSDDTPDLRRVFDRALIARRRGRAASTLPDADFLLTEATQAIAERLAVVLRDFPRAVCLGAQDGRLARALADDRRIGTVISTESCPAMLAGLPHPRLAADEEILPFAAASLDLVVAPLSLHWVNDLPGTLAQIRRALRPDGLFLAVLFGGGTLRELRGSLLQAEADLVGGASLRIDPFLDVRDAGGLLQRAGFALPVADTEMLTVRYADPLRLLADLRAMGWTNALAGRSRRPLRRDVLARALEIYAERHHDPDGRIRASFEFVHLSGWAPHESQQQPLRPGTARMRLAEALGTREQPAGDKAGRADR